MKNKIEKIINDSIEAKQKMLTGEYVDVLNGIGAEIVKAYKAGHKVVLFGNGGSSSDAQHFAAELVARFEKNRAALAAQALCENMSTITAVGNDFGYENVFSRQVEAFVQPGDVVIGITTSGNSPNVIKAMETAKAKKAVAVGFTGEKGGKIKEIADICFCAPSSVTGRIQECHILAVHILSLYAEEKLFGENR